MATDRNGHSICVGARAEMQLPSGANARGRIVYISNDQITIKGRIICPGKRNKGPTTFFGRPHQDVTILD